MPTFDLPVEWKMYGRVEIKADTKEQAIEIAKGPNTPLPHGHYLDDSFVVDEDGILITIDRES